MISSACQLYGLINSSLIATNASMQKSSSTGYNNRPDVGDSKIQLHRDARMASTNASATSRKKLQVLFFPFFAASHIGPNTDFAFNLVSANPNLPIEATIAVTPANVSIVRSTLARRGDAASNAVKIATYPFPRVDGLPPGVENLSTAAHVDAWRIDDAAVNESLMRPAQEALIRERYPDVVVADVQFVWNVGIAADLGVPCILFHVIGSFSILALQHLAAFKNDAQVVTIPRFPSPEIQIPRAELPEFLRSDGAWTAHMDRMVSSQSRCFGHVVNTYLDLEPKYCEMYARNNYVKRAYFVGPLSLPAPPPAVDSTCIKWLGSKPSRSVVYVCFGSFAYISAAQLQELALGLEDSGRPFLWVVRSDQWSPPEGWEDRVGDKGMVVRGWAAQVAILGHPAVGAFLTHCGWNSVLEAATTGVPMLTWPMVFDHFITERLVTEVLGIGERVWGGMRSTRYDEKVVVPAEAVAQAVASFMDTKPGGVGETARARAKELAKKATAAVAEGGSSYCDLHRLIDDLIVASDIETTAPSLL